MKKKNHSTLLRILSYTKPYTAYMIFAFLSAVISVCATLYAPIVIGDAIDFAIDKNNVDFVSINRLLSLLSIVIACSAVFQWLLNYCTNIITHRTLKDMRDDTFKKIQTLPLKDIDNLPHGDLISRIVNDIDQIADGLLQGFSQLFVGIVTILGTIIFMLSINIKIGIAVIVITPLSLFVAWTIAKLTYNKFKEQAAIKGELGGYIEEMIGNQKVVKAFSYEEASKEHFDDINKRLYDVGVKAQFYSSLTNPSTRFVNGLVYALVGIIGALSVISGNGFTVGQLSAFLSYANQYTKPFNEISGVITELQNAFASARRVFAVLDMESESSDEGFKVLTKSDGNVTVKDVAFSYQEDKPFIENLNIEAKSGQRIAIVGPTGCGKTTIINLLMRFYDTDSGTITVDGEDISKVTRNSLRSLYGMVLQDTWLFKGTIKENIAYSKDNATFDEIVSAAKKAHAHGFIMRLEHGYDTMVSEDGENLSQGQRQLLCIARIMLSMPPMLILDEATSSIDTRTELKIQEAFDMMMEGRTSFVVAHRLSTIVGADCILVIDKGKIIEKGTHAELLEKGGFYSNLYNSQFAKIN